MLINFNTVVLIDSSQILEKFTIASEQGKSEMIPPPLFFPSVKNINEYLLNINGRDTIWNFMEFDKTDAVYTIT